METVTDYNALVQTIDQTDKVLLYVMSEGCSVCHADYPKVDDLVDQYGVKGLTITVNDVPEAAGQLSLFTSPVVILFYKSKEIHRQARIINFEELEYRIEQLMEI